MPAAPHRSVTFRTVDAPLLVLGSTQPASHVDEAACRRRGVEVTRRRSGGGAVLLEPGGVLWADVTLPAGDPLAEPDVGRSFRWLGRVWAEALAAAGAAGAEVHPGGLVTTPWSRLVCFGGLGPGEVTLEGHKVVGMAQRRTRDGSLFQCAALLSWDPAALVDLLALAPLEREAAAADLARAAAGLGGRVRPARLEAALLDRLPDGD